MPPVFTAHESPFMTASFPKAVLHIDGDAFFTSVEQALDPSLKGRPVVTGKERGIIACASYEAKRMGIVRAMPLFEARKLCPDLVIVPSDYESYSLYSKRMFDIIRRFTPVVEEYSIDEAFADITGMRRVFRASYEDICLQIQRTVREELDITASVGLSVTKSLAKLASGFRKPSGFTSVDGRRIHLFLKEISLGDVWGFGPNTVSLLQKLGLRTAHDFVVKPEKWAEQLLGKPGREIWNELRGIPVHEVTVKETSARATIIKSKTFTPPTDDRSYVYAQLVRNVESAFARARRYRLKAGTFGMALRTSDFVHEGMEAALNRPVSSALEIIPFVGKLFDSTFRQGVKYRATMVALGKLKEDRTEQYELFEDRLRIERIREATAAIDEINTKYGKHTVRSATSLYLGNKEKSDRDDKPARRTTFVVKGETPRLRLNIPRLTIAV